MILKTLTKLGWTSVLALWTFLWPAVCVAADDQGFQAGLDPGQYRALILLAVVAAAYIVTHLVLERIADRFGFVTGVEYIILGAILGPVLNILDADTLSAFTPAIVLGTGSLGLWGGLHIDFRAFGRTQVHAFKSALVISMFTLLTVLGVSVAALYYFWSPEGVASMVPGILCVGAVALVAETAPIRSMAAFLGAEGVAANFARRVAYFCSTLAIVLFGLIFCFYNTTTVPFDVDPTYVWLVWFGIHLLLGGVLGLIFATFLRRDFSDEKIITIIIGMVIFTSGFAYYLHLSPIFVNFILGVVLINVAPHAEHVESRLRSIQRPLYIVLFFFAGAAWEINAPLWSYALVVGYVILRRAGRSIGSLAALRFASKSSVNAGVGRALLAPGALSVAMLLNYDQVFSAHPYANVIYNALLLAVVATEIFSYPKTRGWLIDVADINPTEPRKSQPTGAQEVD